MVRGGPLPPRVPALGRVTSAAAGHLLTSGASATLKCYSAIRIGNCRCYFLLPVVAEQRPQTLARPQVKYLDLVRTVRAARAGRGRPARRLCVGTP